MTTSNGTNNLAPIAYSNVTQCALVLEDQPVERDSRLNFESFPEDGIEEGYSVAGYREIAANRMPQPLFAAYRGGNWSAFSLNLKFRAGNELGSVASLEQLQNSDLEKILIKMERKARWCQALAFPLERDATTFNKRILARAQAGGISESALKSASLGLTRNDPPIVLVVIGSFLVLRCYVTSYSIKWTHPFHPITARPYGCEVTLAFQRLELDYPTWESIRESPGTFPQSPLLPRLNGTSLVVSSTNRLNSQTRQGANARSEAQARAEDPGAATSSFLSARNDTRGGIS